MERMSKLFTSCILFMCEYGIYMYYLGCIVILIYLGLWPMLCFSAGFLLSTLMSIGSILKRMRS